jgi:hypothetical protein
MNDIASIRNIRALACAAGFGFAAAGAAVCASAAAADDLDRFAGKRKS